MAIPIRAWMLAYEERIGIDDSGQSPLRKIHLLAYAPQDANVATGEFLFREGERGGKQKGRCPKIQFFFDIRKENRKKKALPRVRGNALLSALGRRRLAVVRLIVLLAADFPRGLTPCICT